MTTIWWTDWVKNDIEWCGNIYTWKRIFWGFDSWSWLLSSRLFNYNIIILYSKHKVVTSTFSNPDISRAFSFAMRKKFKYMYQHNPVCQKEFSWLLGLYRNEKGITSVFQLPIYYKDNGSDQVKPHLFVAFKYHKFKIILTLKEIVYSEDVLKSIPPIVVKLEAEYKRQNNNEEKWQDSTKFQNLPYLGSGTYLTFKGRYKALTFNEETSISFFTLKKPMNPQNCNEHTSCECKRIYSRIFL